jgi:2Fe-2S ferredoxin
LESIVPRISFISPDGQRQEFEVPEGTSAMTAARLNSVNGIEAECGGSLSCGTCHVYVGTDFIAKLPAPSEQEVEMLDLVAADRKPGSRLSCQIAINHAIDGIEIGIPESQY